MPAFMHVLVERAFACPPCESPVLFPENGQSVHGAYPQSAPAVVQQGNDFGCSGYILVIPDIYNVPEVSC
ncbi:hypothetical protein D3C86_1999160 [compost metagenome]